MRILFLAPAATLAVTLLSGCLGHQYEPREPGVNISGEASAGVKYQEDKGTSGANDVKVKISVGGSI